MDTPRPGPFGSMRLLRPIGSGGMGDVWLAHDDALGVDRAVKFLRTDRSAEPALRARFVAEARTLAALGDAPGLVRVHAAGEDPATRRPYFVMDAHLLPPERIRDICTRRLGLTPAAAAAISHAEGAEAPFTLQDALGDEATGTARQLPERAVLAIAREIAAALSFLHGHAPPVVHRDLKPANLLFAADGRILLADFGVAKMLDPARTGLTLADAQPGTQRYAAPELLRGDPATPAADWYSLGVVLFRALTSSFPQWGETFPTRAGLRPFSPRWEPLLRDLLAPDPARRLADGAAFARRLDRIEAALDTRGMRSGRAKRIALAFAAAVVATGVAVLLLHRAESGPVESPHAANDSGEILHAKDVEDAKDGSVEMAHAENAEGAEGVAPKPAEPYPGEVRTITLPGGVPLDLIWVPPGTFTMGLSEKERAPCATPSGTIPGDNNPLAPPRPASIPRGFWLAKTELTQEQYAKIEYGETGLPSFGATCPQTISWDMAERTIWSLNRLGTGFAFRMPTEAEWEWAARGGPLGGGHAWSGSDDPDDVAWTAECWPPKGGPVPALWPDVATKRPNELGLFDMSGLFAEWCSDRYYPQHSFSDAEYRVVRGGDVFSSAAFCRNGSFGAVSVNGQQGNWIGLRVAADALP